MTEQVFLSPAGGDIPGELRQPTDIGFRIVQAMGVNCRHYAFDNAGLLSVPQQGDVLTPYLQIYYADPGVARVFVHLYDPGLHEQVYRPFLPSLDPACWALVEAWMVQNFHYSQQQYYHCALLCAVQQGAIRMRSLVFGLLVASLERRCVAFLQAAGVEANDE